MFSNGQRLARETGRHGGQIGDTVTRSHGRSFRRLRCEERGDRVCLERRSRREAVFTEDRPGRINLLRTVEGVYRDRE